MSERITTVSTTQDQVATPAADPRPDVNGVPGMEGCDKAAAEQPPAAIPVEPAAEPTLASVPVVDPTREEMAKAAAAKAEADAARTESLLEQAESLRKAVTKSFRAGEREYRKGLLEAGRLAHSYLKVRMSLGHVRDAAVDTIRGDLSAYSSTKVDINRLCRNWWAYHLLCEGQGLEKKATDMSLGAYINGWSLLLVQQAFGTAEESYVLLPGLENEALAAYKTAAEGGLNAESCTEKAQLLVRQYAEQQAKAKAETDRIAREEAAKAKVAADATEAERRQAARERAEADEAVKRAEAEAKAAKTAAEQAAAQAQLDKANAEREERRRVEAERQVAADAAARERDAKERLAKEAAAAAAKAAADAEKKAQREREKAGKDKTLTVEPAADTDKPATPAKPDTRPEGPSRQGSNILADLAGMAKKAPSKDMAGILAGTVRAAEDSMAVLHDLVAVLASQADTDKACPYGADDVLEAVLTALDGHKALSAKAGRAVKAARVVLSSSARRSPSPAEVASAISPEKAPEASNGSLAAAS